MSGVDHFTGPIFLVGMPRSGTKLLRDLLNNHSRIAITPNESHFIPDFHKRIGEYGELRDPESFRRFYNDFRKTVFFERVIRESNFIDEQSWYKAVKEWTYSGVVEAFYLEYARAKNKTIWGDKTPFYLAVMPQLKALFPSARFVHIVRDVRDYSLSLKKGWNKNIYRSSQRWHDVVRKGRLDGKNLPAGDFYEVCYESLVDAPAETLAGICRFLQVPYEESLATLHRPADKGGDVRNRLDIVQKNYGKWETALSKGQIAKIERMCGDILSDLGYKISYAGATKRLGAMEMELYKILDALSLLRFEVRENGIVGGMRNMVRTVRYSQFRDVPEEER